MLPATGLVIPPRNPPPQISLVPVWLHHSFNFCFCPFVSVSGQGRLILVFICSPLLRSTPQYGVKAPLIHKVGRLDFVAASRTTLQHFVLEQ